MLVHQVWVDLYPMSVANIRSQQNPQTPTRSCMKGNPTDLNHSIMMKKIPLPQGAHETRVSLRLGKSAGNERCLQATCCQSYR